MEILNPNNELKVVKTPYEVSGVILEAHIPNKNGTIYSPSVFDKLNKTPKIEVRIGNEIIGLVQSFQPSQHSEDLEPHPCFPNINILSTPIQAKTRKLTVNFSLDIITFEFKDKKFGILSKNKEVAEKIVTLQLKDWITYLQYEDDGIVELVKFLIGMKYKESYGSDEVMQDWFKESAKQIAEEVDKELLQKMLE